MTALTGKSGSGKTTLLNCLGLIHPIDSGKIFVDNNDVTGWRESQRTLFWKDHASFIYQDYGIIDDETVSFLKKFKRPNKSGVTPQIWGGFGINGKEQADAIAPYVTGVIAGSVFVRIIDAAAGDKTKLMQTITAKAKEIKE